MNSDFRIRVQTKSNCRESSFVVDPVCNICTCMETAFTHIMVHGGLSTRVGGKYGSITDIYLKYPGYRFVENKWYHEILDNLRRFYEVHKSRLRNN